MLSEHSNLRYALMPLDFSEVTLPADAEGGEKLFDLWRDQVWYDCELTPGELGGTLQRHGATAEELLSPLGFQGSSQPWSSTLCIPV